MQPDLEELARFAREAEAWTRSAQRLLAYAVDGRLDITAVLPQVEGIAGKAAMWASLGAELAELVAQ